MLRPTHQKSQFFSSTNFDEHKNKFGKGWSPGSKLLLDTNTSTITTSKIDFSDHPFIKDNKFEVNVNLPPRGTPIGIVAQYCEHHNM